MKFRNFNKSLLALGLATLYTVSTFASVATDVSANHWAYTAITDLENRGIVTYNSKGQFFPNNQMTYFEVADILAKATGYVNVEIATNVDETFKNQIINNYNNQKSTLASYATKYSTWDKLYDQQVAYILGRGFISKTDLDKFITKANNKETKAIMTKQDLAVYIVRILGKEKTAQADYVAGAFNDESLISATNRPYMAYLKSIGMITPDAKGNSNPNTPVTKALCAKMVSDALKIKEAGTDNNTNSGTNGGQTNNTSGETVTFKKMMSKNTSEQYIAVQKEGDSKTIYYTVKNTLKAKDEAGNEISLSSLTAEQKITVTYELINNIEYITSIKIVGNGNSNSNSNANSGSDTIVNASTVTGTLLERVSNGIVRISLSDGQTRTYILDSNCIITLNGVTADSSALNAGDTVVVSVANATITKVQATKGTGTTVGTLSSGEIIAKQVVLDGYNVTLKQGTSEATIFIPEKATIKRNNKIRNLEDLRIGDQISLTKTGTTVSAVTATGEQSSVTGMIKEIHLAQPGRVVVNTGKETVTYTLGTETEIYDINSRRYINLRDLHLGQEIDLLLESKEVVSLDVVKSTSAVNYKGIIKNVSRGSDYIDVLVDYDPISGQTQIYKRIEVPNSLSIINNNKEVNRNTLDIGMEVVITYKYLDDSSPEKILIIG